MRIGRTLTLSEIISPLIGIFISSYSVNAWTYEKLTEEMKKPKEERNSRQYASVILVHLIFTAAIGYAILNVMVRASNDNAYCDLPQWARDDFEIFGD
jgi:L-lactate permease